MQIITYVPNILTVNDLNGLYPGRSPLIVQINAVTEGGVTVYNSAQIDFSVMGTNNIPSKTYFHFLLADGRIIRFYFLDAEDMDTFKDPTDAQQINMPLHTGTNALLKNIRILDKYMDKYLPEFEVTNVGKIIKIQYNNFSTALYAWDTSLNYNFNKQVNYFFTENSIINSVEGNVNIILYLFETERTYPTGTWDENDIGKLIDTRTIAYMPSSGWKPFSNYFNLNGLQTISNVDYSYWNSTGYQPITSIRSYYYILQVRGDDDVEIEILRSSYFNVCDAQSYSGKRWMNDDYLQGIPKILKPTIPVYALPWGKIDTRTLSVDSTGDLNLILSAFAGGSNLPLTINLRFFDKNGQQLRMISRSWTVVDPQFMIKFFLDKTDIPAGTAYVLQDTTVSGSQTGTRYRYNLKDICITSGEFIYVMDGGGFMQTWSFWGGKTSSYKWSADTVYRVPTGYVDNTLEYEHKINIEDKTTWSLSSGWVLKTQGEQMLNCIKDQRLQLDTNMIPIIIDSVENEVQNEFMNLKITYHLSDAGYNEI